MRTIQLAHRILIVMCVMHFVPGRAEARGKRVCCQNVPAYENELYRVLRTQCKEEFRDNPALADEANRRLLEFKELPPAPGGTDGDCGQEKMNLLLFNCAVPTPTGECGQETEDVDNLCAPTERMAEVIGKVMNWARDACHITKYVPFVVDQKQPEEPPCCCKSPDPVPPPVIGPIIINNEHNNTFNWTDSMELTTWATIATDTSSMDILRPSVDTVANVQLPIALSSAGSSFGGAAAIVPGLAARKQRRAHILTEIVQPDVERKDEFGMMANTKRNAAARQKAESQRYNGFVGYWRYVVDSLQFSLSSAEAVTAVDQLRGVQNRAAVALSSHLYRTGYHQLDSFCAAEVAPNVDVGRTVLAALDRLSRQKAVDKAVEGVLAKYRDASAEPRQRALNLWARREQLLAELDGVDPESLSSAGASEVDALKRSLRELAAAGDRLKQELPDSDEAMAYLVQAVGGVEQTAALRDFFKQLMNRCRPREGVSRWLLAITGTSAMASRGGDLIRDRTAMGLTLDYQGEAQSDDWIVLAGTLALRYADSPDLSGGTLPAYSIRPTSSAGARLTAMTHAFDFSMESTFLVRDYFVNDSGTAALREPGASFGGGFTVPLFQGFVLSSSAHVRFSTSNTRPELLGLASLGWRESATDELQALQTWQLSR